MFLYSNIESSWCVSIIALFLTWTTSARTVAKLDKPIPSFPMHTISLQNKEAFRPGATNWHIAGGVRSNRFKYRDLHSEPGSGIIVNNPTSSHHRNLVTKMKHGNIELELDFLLSKGSSSGVYLQGRYEVVLYDSWGVEQPKFSDCGGIYQRWDASKPQGQRGSGGYAPSVNVCRAPGLWQHLKIIFKAPEFDKNGYKVSNAELKKVWLNGVLVQKQVKVSGPTREPIVDDEQPKGPLMLQGVHGPVAFRNIQYKKM